jgi:hypothetical protein
MSLPPRALVRCAAAGVALGAFAAAGDRLPVDTPLVLVALANAVGPWLVVAFLSGSAAATMRTGATLGTVTLLVAVVAYYVVAATVLGGPYVDPTRASVVWSLIAVAIGLPTGAAGAAWASGTGRWRIAGVSLLAGLLLAEAVSRFVEVEGWTGYDLGRTALQVAAVDGAAAFMAVWLLAARDRVLAAAGALLVGAAGAVLLAVAIPLIRTSAAG